VWKRNFPPLGVALLLGIWSPAMADAPQADMGGYRTAVVPFVAKYCGDCHGEEVQEGNLDLSRLDPNMIDGTDAEHWNEVLGKLNLSEMPPKDEPQPPADELLKVIDWITGELEKARAVAAAQGGRIVLRRLNRTEYKNTIRDLTGLPIGVSLDPTEKFLADTPTEGFDNVGQGLLVSSLHIESYMRAAETIVDCVVEERPQPPTKMHWRIEAPYRKGDPFRPHNKVRGREQRAEMQAYLDERLKLAKEELFQGRAHKNATQKKNFFGKRTGSPVEHLAWDMTTDPPTPYRRCTDVAVNADHVTLYAYAGSPWHLYHFNVGQILNEEGIYRARVRASGFAPDDYDGPPPTMKVILFPEGKVVDEITLTDQTQTYEFKFHCDAHHVGERLYGRDFWGVQLMFPVGREMEIPDPDKKGRTIRETVDVGGHVEWVELEGPIYRQWPPEQHRRVFFDSPHRDNEEAYAREVLQRFLHRAYRRPPTAREVDELLAQFTEARAGGDEFLAAMKKPLRSALISPNFLYLVEPSSEDGSTRRLTAYELASRLSYFLWRTMPDEELFARAADGTLTSDDELQRQIERMLKDANSDAFVNDFTKQWLGLRDLEDLNPDEDLFPEFDSKLKRSSTAETQAFIREILRNDLSLLNLLDSDFLVLDERMARHYGVDGVRGDEFRRVPLAPESDRGGVLTQASVLTVTSDGFRTLPVTRGTFILERLLGDPPPPPPPNAGNLEDLIIPDRDKLTTRQLLEAHRRNTTCAACHNKIDPLGFALEAFDPIGQRRTHEWSWDENKKRPLQGNPVETAGRLPSGVEFGGAAELKRLLREEKHEVFLKCLVEKLLIFALGRPTTFADEPLVDALQRATREDDYRFRTLITQIVLSEAFRSK